MKEFLKRIDWVNASFLILTPIIAFSGVGYLLATGGIHTYTIILAVIMAVATGFGVTAGYHRLFSHRSYDAKWPVKLFLLVLGAAAFENSALRWSSDHRNHHKFVDTDQDPYNIKQGFWYAHMGWIFFKEKAPRDFDNVPDLVKDPLVQFQERHYVKLGILAGFGFPSALAALWGDALGGLLIAGFLRTVMNHHFTFSINSWCHYFGKQPYSDKNTSRDSWFPALFTYGEGYHNYHHTFPSDYRNGIRSYHWDPTKWLIRGLEMIGQTSNLRRISNMTILKSRLKMDEKNLLRKIEKANHAVEARREFVIATRVKIEEAYARFRSLKEEIRQLKEAKIHALSERLVILNGELARAKAALHQAVSEWSHLCGSFGVSSSRLVISV